MNRTLLGALLIIASQFFSASVMTAVKVVSERVPTVDVIFVSYTVSALIVTLVIFAKPKIGFKSEYLSLQLARSVVGVLYFGGLMWAVTYIPVVDTILLRSTAPIWAPFMALLWLHQSIDNRIWPRIFIAFIGVALILHPTLVGLNIGYLIALVAAMSYALSGILIKELNKKQEPLLRTLFYAFTIPAIVLLPYAATHIPSDATQLDAVLLGFIGVGTLVLLLLYISGLRYASVVVVLPVTYTGVIFAALYDWYLWGQAPHALTLLGMVFVFIGCYAIVRLEATQSA